MTNSTNKQTVFIAAHSTAFFEDIALPIESVPNQARSFRRSGKPAIRQ
jgi:hypothetical protein